MSGEFGLEVVHATEIKTYKEPDFINQKEITPGMFLLNFPVYLRLYMEDKRRPSSDTIATYEATVRLFLKWCDAVNVNPFEAGELQMRAYIDHLRARNLADSTVKLKLVALRTFYKIAVRMKLIEENPCENLALPSVRLMNDDEFKYYTVNEIREICEAFTSFDPASCARNQLIVYLMAVEGLRCVEIMRLNDEDVDYDNKAIIIRGKGGAKKPIFPCDKTMDRLVMYLSKRGPIEPVDGFTPMIVSFSNNNYGRRITRDGIRYVVNTALEIADMKYPHHTCHILRHSCGTNLYDKTRDIRAVQEVLRHASPTMTARYSHVIDRKERRDTKLIAPDI